MAKFVWNMSSFHKDWRKTKEAAEKKAKELANQAHDKTIAARVEKWMKDNFNRKLGDKFDDTHKAFEKLQKVGELAKPRLSDQAMRDKVRAAIKATVNHLDFAEVTLDTYRQSVNSGNAVKTLPPEVLAMLKHGIEALQKEVNAITRQVAEWQNEVHKALDALSSLKEHQTMDVTEIAEKYYPEILIK